MKKILISFGSYGYETALKSLSKSASPYFNEIRIFGEKDINDIFWNNYPDHRNVSRGYHLWLWKSYLILRNLETLGPDDVLMYTDALMVFKNNPEILFSIVNQENGLLLFHQKREGHINYTCTKKDCFALMGCDEERYIHGDHLNAAFLVCQNKPKSVDFIKEWFYWCSNFQIISDSPNICGDNYSGFMFHRHDQSILSLLTIKHNYNTFKDPSQWGENYKQNPDYPPLLWHHRNLGYVL